MDSNNEANKARLYKPKINHHVTATTALGISLQRY